MFDCIRFGTRTPLCNTKEGHCGVVFCRLWCLCDPVSPSPCWASFLPIFHDWKHNKVNPFCTPITNNISLHILLDICVYIYTTLTPVGTYMHMVLYNGDLNGIYAVFFFFPRFAKWGHLPYLDRGALLRSLWGDGLIPSFTHSFLALQEDAILQL